MMLLSIIFKNQLGRNLGDVGWDARRVQGDTGRSRGRVEHRVQQHGGRGLLPEGRCVVDTTDSNGKCPSLCYHSSQLSCTLTFYNIPSHPIHSHPKKRDPRRWSRALSCTGPWCTSCTADSGRSSPSSTGSSRWSFSSCLLY